MTQPFPKVALDEFVYACNSMPHVTAHMAIGVTDLAITLVLQEGTDALVVHLLSEGDHDVTLVNEPSLPRRIQMSQLLTHLSHRWKHVGFPFVGARLASVQCYDGA